MRLLKQLPRIWRNQAQGRRKISANALCIEPIPNLVSIAKYQSSSVYFTFFIAPDKWPDNFRGIPGKAEQLDIGWTVSTSKINVCFGPSLTHTFHKIHFPSRLVRFKNSLFLPLVKTKQIFFIHSSVLESFLQVQPKTLEAGENNYSTGIPHAFYVIDFKSLRFHLRFCIAQPHCADVLASLANAFA